MNVIYNLWQGNTPFCLSDKNKYGFFINVDVFTLKILLSCAPEFEKKR